MFCKERKDIMKNLKIKPLSKQKIIISIDRLTRFKPTDEKYSRVFNEIILSNLLEPKFKKDELNKLDVKKIVELVEKIFDFSLKSLNLTPTNDFSINEKLLQHETATFKVENIGFLKNRIDYKAFFPLLDGELPLNLRWLKHIDEGNVRETYSTKFPIKKVLLVEGITEEILLPEFAKAYGYDFDKNGIYVLPAGGKNQSVKTFYALSQVLKLPIFVLFDKDARQNSDEIEPKLRGGDTIHILECGEFEDTLSPKHIKRALNARFKNYYTFSVSQLQPPMTKTLDLIFKECNSEFKKSEFAHILSETLKNDDLTDDIKEILVKLSCR